jgi:hypothetical protein
MKIIGQILGVLLIIFILWVGISIFAGIVVGISEMPYEDGPIDGCENLKETIVKQKEVLKESWNSAGIDTIKNK